MIEKQVAMARSGVYQYWKPELAAIKPDGPIPDKYADKKFFNVYRPAVVLQKVADRFRKLPVVRTHDAGWITPENFRDNVIGWTGENVSVVVDSESGEVTINSTINLFDKEAIDFMRDGLREVSPAYQAHFIWSEGVAPDGTDYQIIMDDVIEGNALALVDAGRGGNRVKIMDEALDHDMGAFRNALEEIAIERKNLSSDEIQNAIDNLWTDIGDELPESPEKDKLYRFLMDFSRIRDLEDDKAETFTNLVADLYESLDNDAMEADMFGKKKAKDEAPATEEPKKLEGEKVEPDTPEQPKDEDMGAITIDDIPEDPSAWEPEHATYMMNELKKLIQKDLAGNAGQGPEPGEPEDEDTTSPEAQEKEIKMNEPKVGDGVFTASMGSRAKVEKLGDFVSDLYKDRRAK